ncbi:hypothetical protein CANCADRAFT_101386 [Tortispora caseinolytica NRRL Y-17796]|uniref:Glutamine synthetase n=1 Tax=Tortispora caseinolytica NRRL Y-17796 TaxID=767744 RepID=A0A1E4TEC8_9ASCO|nr:hypothetical protein CANCADRAFT_101386 [Tortispora caseinolytica NRRL Y-17796]
MKDWTAILADDDCVKLSGIDVDGILRGKLISKKKFLSVAETGFGFCSVIFGWDMHDRTYNRSTNVTDEAGGFGDLHAVIDLESFTRIPWENNVPFFYVYFYNPDQTVLAPCPRSLLRDVSKLAADMGYTPMAGSELEFYHYKETGASVIEKNGKNLTPMTAGMFGYSVQRPVLNKEYYYDVWNSANAMDVNIEGWHCESGPGVYEAAITYAEALKVADRTSLFKLTCKSVGPKYGVMPCFMAKPHHGLPGNSGHLHLSLLDSTGKNILCRDEPDPNPKYPDTAYLTEEGKHFLAGILAGLKDIMPILAPNINSYKRLIEHYWAPVTVSWGYEHRIASVRFISPPSCPPKGTRFEVRTPGADVNTHFALAALFALGIRGIKLKLPLTVPPMGAIDDHSTIDRLPKSLRTATEAFMSPTSLAREVLGNEFVDHFGKTRLEECDLWDDAVTDWEVTRYIETA